MGQGESGIRLRSSGRSSIGQVRQNNEDTIHLWYKGDVLLAVVADGMGGAAAGEEASRIAVESIRDGLGLDKANPTPTVGDDTSLTERLRGAIQSANSNIVRKSSSSAEFRGMGTTLTMTFMRGTYAVVAHVGDSRAYLVNGKTREITQITADHSFVEALRLAGHITEEQALNHPLQHVLYRALGQSDDVDIDMYYKRVHVGDRLVLCSDGLTRHIEPAEIGKYALEYDDPDLATQKLIDLTNARGGEDNVSVIIVSVEGNEGALDTVPLDEVKAALLRRRTGTQPIATPAVDEALIDTADDDEGLTDKSSQATARNASQTQPEGRDNRNPDQ